MNIKEFAAREKIGNFFLGNTKRRNYYFGSLSKFEKNADLDSFNRATLIVGLIEIGDSKLETNFLIKCNI